jgi:hypothetical protein
MDSLEKKKLVDDALAKIGTDGEIAAMKWLANQIEASYEAKLKELLTRNEINDKLLFQMMNY